MKKVLLVVVGLAVALCFASTSYSEDSVKVKEKVKETAAGTVTTEKAKVETADVKITEKAKAVTKGDVTKETAKILAQPKHGDMKRAYFKVTKIEDNDPANNSDNTITVITEKDEVLKMPVKENIKLNHIKNHKDKTVTIYSTYDINAKDWIVTKLEE